MDLWIVARQAGTIWYGTGTLLVVGMVPLVLDIS